MVTEPAPASHRPSAKRRQIRVRRARGSTHCGRPPGYAVECALKACIAKETKQYDFPPDRKAVEAIYKHNPNDLLKPSTLEREHAEARRASSAFDANWKIVQGWTEQSRYQQGKSEKEVVDFFSAIVGDEGVLPWLKKSW